MNNVLRMLSVNKDYRIVIADTARIADKTLSDFRGTGEIRSFLEHIITHCTLLSSVNETPLKISFSFRLSRGVSIFCQITDSSFTMDYCDTLHTFDGTAADLFDNKSVMSITTGNWETGLHTGTVEAHMDNAAMLFSHYTAQSEQLPSYFVMAEDQCTRGLLMQPLPFADERLMAKAANEMTYHAKELGVIQWEQIPHRIAQLAYVISENKIE